MATVADIQIDTNWTKVLEVEGYILTKGVYVFCATTTEDVAPVEGIDGNEIPSYTQVNNITGEILWARVQNGTSAVTPNTKA